MIQTDIPVNSYSQIALQPWAFLDATWLRYANVEAVTFDISFSLTHQISGTKSVRCQVAGNNVSMHRPHLNLKEYFLVVQMCVKTFPAVWFMWERTAVENVDSPEIVKIECETAYIYQNNWHKRLDRN